MKDKNLFGILVASALLSTTMPVMAADITDDKEKVLPPVVVAAQKEKKTAEKKPQEPVYSRLMVPESAQAGTETFTREDIEAMHPRNVYDILEQAKGILVTFQGRKHPYLVKDRGGDNMGIILDGVYLPFTVASREVASIPVGMIESVKIVRDSTVLTVAPMGTFASDQAAPIQGFVIITTRKSSSLENEIKIGYGTFNAKNYQFLHGDKKTNFYYDIAYTKNKTDGKDNWYNFSDSESFFLKSGYNNKGFVSNFSLFVDKTTMPFQRGIEKGILSTSKWGYDPMDTIAFSFDMAKQWDKQNTTAFNFGYTNVNADFHGDTFGRAPVSVVNYQDYWREFNLWHTITTSKDTLKFGGQMMEWHSPNGDAYGRAEQHEKLYGYYITDEHRINDRLTMDSGVRLDKKNIITGNSDAGHIITNQWAQDGKTYSIGAAYKMDSVYKASTRFSYSNQPCNEFISKIRNFNDPEVRHKYEAGMTANYNKAFNVALTTFYYNIDNAKIVDHTTGTGLNTINWYDEANVGRRGLELGFNGHLSDFLKYNLSYSYIKSSNVADESQLSSNTYTLQLNYKNKNIAANMTALHLDSFISNGKQVGGFIRVDANIAKEIDANRTITLYARNIGDVQYATIYRAPNLGYFYDVGRTYGIEYSWKY